MDIIGVILVTERTEESPTTSHRIRTRSGGAKKITLWPHLVPKSTTSYTPLQNKISQESLLEKRTMRKIAEIELKRKSLELDKAKWAFERQKIETEARWAHEVRLMEFKEEREKMSIEFEKSQRQQPVLQAPMPPPMQPQQQMF